MEFSQAMYHSWSGIEVERNGDAGEGIACGGTLPEACLWEGHSSLHPFPLSVKEEWFCQGSGGLCDVCVWYVIEDAMWHLAGTTKRAVDSSCLQVAQGDRSSGGLGALSPVEM